MKYVKRSNEGLAVVDREITSIKCSLKKYLNIECLKYGSSIDGRVSSMKYLLNRKGLVPLYVNPKVLLLFTCNIREWDVIVVNYYRIISLRESTTSNTVVVFDDYSELVLNVSFNRFKIQYDMAKTINRLIS